MTKRLMRRWPRAAATLVAFALGACAHDFDKFEGGGEDPVDGGRASSPDAGARTDASTSPTADASGGGSGTCDDKASCFSTARTCRDGCGPAFNACKDDCDDGQAGETCRKACEDGKKTCESSCSKTCETCAGADCAGACP